MAGAEAEAVTRRTTSSATAFCDDLRPPSPLRDAIDRLHRADEATCVQALLPLADQPQPVLESARGDAAELVKGLRANRAVGPVQGLMQEFALTSQEGVALMCLAEALLRIPDAATRNALISDKIGKGDWLAHVGHSPSAFVNAATWGLFLTGRLVSPVDESGLVAALTRVIARGGAPVVRLGVDTAMRMFGEQFVCGQTIESALERSAPLVKRGFRYSYDMLGEGAVTAEDAERYFAAYERALSAIGAEAKGRGVYESPSLSIKLSALHPRYQRQQSHRVRGELLPRLLNLTRMARDFDVSVNIDAEESERLDISLDLLEALCQDEHLRGWDGVGFVIQAYQKRAVAVVDFVIDLARRTTRRIMTRLVKGAYWDSEVKRAQVEGQPDFPVFTRKAHTDVSYLACARKMLSAPEAVYPQFATHNALTLATIRAMAGDDFKPRQYEFQCLHGMGVPLYSLVLDQGRAARPARVYAPVGSHETLLPYLVRRLLENGANTSFVHQVADDATPIEALLQDPCGIARAQNPVGAPHPAIRPPKSLYAPERANSRGYDLASEMILRDATESLAAEKAATHDLDGHGAPSRAVLNPCDGTDVVGSVVDADASAVDALFRAAEAAKDEWAGLSPQSRGDALRSAADRLETKALALAALIVREAGKTMQNAIGEVREAADFLRYYAARGEEGVSETTHRPLGVAVCISPWNFPLAIFVGQVACALSAGNVVIAKPAEETPLIAAEAVGVLHEAGVLKDALQLAIGDGHVGQMLTDDDRAGAVMFTGSSAVAKLIERTLSRRLGSEGKPVPFVAETGGLNAMIVDSSALAEQVAADVLASAFDSAGQRCSALRLLCLQADIADETLAKIKGAARELIVAPTDRLSTDVGPVITRQALTMLKVHVETMRGRGLEVTQAPLPEDCRSGAFMPPTIIEIASAEDIDREVFGPILHVLRYRRNELDDLVSAINRKGFALTGGVQSRIDGTIDRLAKSLSVGNLYVNRNVIGAVVGVQPFGGHGLSGTGPKAGGPLAVKRLMATAPQTWPPLPPGEAPAQASAFARWLESVGEVALALRVEAIAAASRLGARLDCPGPVGESNVYELKPRGVILCAVEDPDALVIAAASALATGNMAALDSPIGREFVAKLPSSLREWIYPYAEDGPFQAALTDAEGETLKRLLRRVAARDEAVTSVHALSKTALAAGAFFPLDWLLEERTISVNTAAAGGNATLMAIG